MVVTGDRDLFQLVEPGVRVMATGRGITDTKIYDREAVLDRYGIPPELIPDFVGLKGDTSDNIPGVPGSATRRRRSCSRSGARSRACSTTSTRSRAPSARRTSPSTPRTRASRSSSRRRCATWTWTSTSTKVAAREPDRSRLRETFREFELRAPLERLEEALGEDDAAPAERVDEVIRVQAREVPVAELGALDGRAGGVAALRPGEDLRRGGRRSADDPDEELAAEEDAALEAAVEERAGRRPSGRRRPGAGLVRLRRRAARAAHRRGLGRRGGARGRGGDARRVHDGARRAAGRGPRLEDDRDGRRGLRGAAARRTTRWSPPT